MYPWLDDTSIVVKEEVCILQWPFSSIFKELNIRNLTVTGDKGKYGIKLRGRLNPVVGARLKSQVKVVMEAVRNLTEAQLEEYVKVGHHVINIYMPLSPNGSLMNPSYRIYVLWPPPKPIIAPEGASNSWHCIRLKFSFNAIDFASQQVPKCTL